MAIQVADNFQYLGQKPLDARVKYATVADMAAVAASSLYDGIMAYVVATEKNYQWKSTNTVDPTLGKWREFQSGGGASNLNDLGDVNIDDPADGEVLKYDEETGKWVNGDDVGGAGRAKSEAIVPVFDATATYAAGDRVMYEDELYVFNTAHTGAWDAADADKSDVDSEIPDKLTSQQMQEIKDAFSGMNKGAPLRMMHYSTEEQVVGTWIDGKPVYQKTIQITTPSTATNWGVNWYDVRSLNIDTFVNGYGSLSTDDGFVCLIPSIWTTDDTVSLFDFGYNDGYLHCSVSGNWINRSGIIHLLYTKTTDTPQ